MPPAEEQLDEHQRRADGDGRIGHIECGPAIRSQPDFQEIGYAAVEQAVERIACRSAQNQREPALRKPAARAAREQQPHQQRHHRSRAQQQKRREPWRTRVGKHAERDARILIVNQNYDVRNNRPAERKRSCNARWQISWRGPPRAPQATTTASARRGCDASGRGPVATRLARSR